MRLDWKGVQFKHNGILYEVFRADDGSVNVIYKPFEGYWEHCDMDQELELLAAEAVLHRLTEGRAS